MNWPARTRCTRLVTHLHKHNIFLAIIVITSRAHQLHHHHRLHRCRLLRRRLHWNAGANEGVRKHRHSRMHVEPFKWSNIYGLVLNNLSSSRLFVQDLWVRDPYTLARPFACACLIPTSILPKQLPLPVLLSLELPSCRVSKANVQAKESVYFIYFIECQTSLFFAIHAPRPNGINSLHTIEMKMLE